MNVDVYSKVYSFLLQRVISCFPREINLRFDINYFREILIRGYNDQFILRLYNDGYKYMCIPTNRFNLTMLNPDSTLFKKGIVDTLLENAKESDIFIKYFDFDYIFVNKGETLESLLIQADLEANE